MAPHKNEPVTYSEAFQELQTIVSEIENGSVSVDHLSEKVRRATLLIGICKAKLTATEAEVNQLLAAIDHPPENEND